MGAVCEVNTKTVMAMKSAVTATLNTTFVKPVATPQEILVTARLGLVGGRKYSVTADVKDGDGVVLAKADVLWIGVGYSEVKL